MARLTEDYNLLKKNPDLSREWHPTKNDDLRPQDVTPGTERKVWWICERGHEWEETVANRNHGRGCPFCNGPRREKPRLSDWISANSRIGYGKAIRKIRRRPSGTVLVEMPEEAWQNLSVLTLPLERLGSAIREYRKKNRLTQDEFGQLVGLHRNRVISLEKNRNDWLSIPRLKRIVSVILV